MRYLIVTSFFLQLLLGCQPPQPTAKPVYLYHDSLNQLQLGDSAYIHISYPQGTAFHQYQLTDSAALTIVTSHQKNEGNAANSGGSRSETLYLRTVKTGQTVVRLTDVSAAAQQAAANSNTGYRNYRIYPIRVTDTLKKE